MMKLKFGLFLMILGTLFCSVSRQGGVSSGGPDIIGGGKPHASRSL